MTKLRWLHVTDLHIGMNDRGHYPASRRILLDDLRYMTEQHGPWDVVLFTGDLVFSGKREQYDKLTSELDGLWQILTLEGTTPAPVLLPVPGNHDLDRDKVRGSVAEGLQGKENVREALWNNKSPDDQRDVAGWFAEYTTWWDQCPYRPQPPDAMRPGLLPGDWSFVLEKGGFRFGFVGLNTAWLHVFKEIREGDLHADVRQLQSACPPDLDTWVRERCDVAFLLSHHPPAWLHEAAREHYEEVIAPPGRFLAHLCGHLHEALSDDRQLGNDAPRRIRQASSLFGLEKLPDGSTDRRHGYTAGEIRMTDDQAEVITWPRLAFRMQSKSWQVTADPTFRLENHLANTPALSVPLARASKSAHAVLDTLADAAPPRGPVSWPERAFQSALWGRMSTPHDHRELARDLIAHCQNIWQEGCSNSVGKDHWLDEHYAVRVLERLEAWLAPTCGPEQTLLMVVAPFAHQALVAAAAHVFMEGARPEDLKDTASSTEPRNTLEQVHRNHPSVVRRAEGLKDADRMALVTWLMHRAIGHVPVLWAEEPELPLAVELRKRVDVRCQGQVTVGWRDILDLARFAIIDPATLERRHGTTNRDTVLAELFHVAAQAALNPRAISEVPVAQLGLGDAFHIDGLLGALRRAVWTERGDSHVLACQCEHPVSDWVLCDLVTTADQRLQRLHDRWSGNPDVAPFLKGLPRRLSDSDVQPAMDEHGRRCYRRPHVHFVLEHDRVRELLMGERIYRDPALAIREMYQNALDACRYRRARETFLDRQGKRKWTRNEYQGRIEFHQDSDEQGRHYIECRDNGVGMGEREIAQVFAVAGRRFVDTSEFLDERAAWRRCEPPIELHQNSQFGIGVLSYFLLADDVLVKTRRFQRDGTPGPGIEIRISGVSGMFHMRDLDDAELPDPGTHIRVYLRSDLIAPEAEQKAIKMEEDELSMALMVEAFGGKEQETIGVSCYKLLNELLWFAEFETHVYDASHGELHWPAGKLAPGGKPASEQEYGASGYPDIWWHFQLGYEGNHLLLADGIRTHSPEWDELDYKPMDRPSFCVVNLHGSQFPKLSLDRTQILQWNEADFEALIRTQAESLASWPGLSMVYLWSLTQSFSAPLAQRATEILYQRRGTVVLNLKPEMTSGQEVQTPIKNLGVFPGDGSLIDTSADSVFYDFHLGGLPAVRAWRRELLRLYAEPSNVNAAPEPHFARMDQLAHVRLEPLDAPLLHHTAPISMLDLVTLTRRHERPYGKWLERVRRFEPLGLRLDPRCHAPETFDPALLSDDDIQMLTLDHGFSPENRWLRGTVKPIDIIARAHRLNRAPSDIARRVRELAPFCGLEMSFDAARLDSVSLDELDLKILSRSLHSASLWPSGVISAAHVIHAARQVGAPASQIAARLMELAEPLRLQVNVPGKLQTLDELSLTEDDLLLLSKASLTHQRVPAFIILQTLPSLKHLSFNGLSDLKRFSTISLGEVERVYERVRALAPLGIEPPKLDPASLIAMLHEFPSALDMRVENLGEVSKLFEVFRLFAGQPRERHSSAAAKLLALAYAVERPLSRIIPTLEALDFISEDMATVLCKLNPAAGPHPDCNAALADCIYRAMASGSVYLDGEILAEARGHIYWLTDEQVHAQLEHIAPLVEFARKYADSNDLAGEYLGYAWGLADYLEVFL